jgi:uncharacterized membrane protein
MQRLSKAMWWLITGLFMALLVIEGQFLGALRSQPQAVRDMDSSWNIQLIAVIVQIFFTVACFWLYLDLKRRSKPPQESDF